MTASMGHHKKQSGFTIVELLIVVVVIAILAAITIVAYNGIQNRSKQSAAQAAVNQGIKKVSLWQVDRPGQSPTLAEFTDLVGAANIGQYQYTAGSNGGFCITGTSGSFSYFGSNTQSTPAAGSCPGHGSNGSPVITNLIPNPSFETGTTGYGINMGVGTADNAWAQNGTLSLRIAPNVSTTDSFANVNGDLGALRLGMEAGKTYTASGTIRLAAAQTGSLAGAARRLTAWYTVGGAHTRIDSSAAANAAGATRLSVTFTVPAGATAAWLRLYNGASTGNGDVWWDSIMLNEGSSAVNYADGTSSNWLWSGTAHNSPSYGSQP